MHNQLLLCTKDLYRPSGHGSVHIQCFTKGKYYRAKPDGPDWEVILNDEGRRHIVSHLDGIDTSTIGWANFFHLMGTVI